MKTSEMIKKLQDAINWNGDQELVVMVYGKKFPDLEIYTDDENELYIEAYLPDDSEEDLFIRQHVMYKDWRKGD